MARSRVIPNLFYGTIGLAVTGAAVYYAVRTLRRRRADSGLHGDDTMTELRRTSRKAGRAVKDAGSKVGKEIGRGVEDTAEAFRESAVLQPDAMNRY